MTCRNTASQRSSSSSCNSQIHWVTWYNSAAYDNKIRPKLTILSYTTIFFTKESTVHQKKKSRIFSHSTNLEPSCPPFYQLRGSRRDSPSACQAPNIQTLPGVKLRKRKSSIVHHPSLSIFARKITLEQIVLPRQKKKTDCLCLVCFLHENLQ